MRARRKNMFFPSLPSDQYRRRGASSLRTRRFVTGRREAIRNSVFPSGPPLRRGTLRRVFTKSCSVVGFSASRPRVRVHGISQAVEESSRHPLAVASLSQSATRLRSLYHLLRSMHSGPVCRASVRSRLNFKPRSTRARTSFLPSLFSSTSLARSQSLFLSLTRLRRVAEWRVQ